MSFGMQMGRSIESSVSRQWSAQDSLVSAVVSYPYIPSTYVTLKAIAVGRDVFRPDANTLVELLIRIQSEYSHFSLEESIFDGLSLESPVDPADTQLGHYLIATWAKVCQALGAEFEPYLPVVMPALLATASAKADVSVYGLPS